jgi:hypothetical protein
VTAGSATGALAREVDWGETPLGPPSTWPTALRVAVEMCFTTRFPVLVTWGPELTMIYNDGYRDMLGSEKHPGAMGAPLAEVWKEVWDDLLPSVERVMLHGEPTWTVDQHLLARRSGYDEDAYFTYSTWSAGCSTSRPRPPPRSWSAGACGCSATCPPG